MIQRLAIFNRRKLVGSILSLVAIELHCVATMADSPGVTLLAGITGQHDDNLFRRHDGIAVEDDIQSQYLGFNLDKSYSLQRFLLEAVVTDNQYQNNDYLDYRGKNLNATWFWAFTPQVTGKLGVTQSEQLNSFIDAEGTAKNIRQLNSQHGDMSLHLGGGWYLLGGARRDDVENSILYFASGDYESTAFEYGAQYKFASGSSLSLMNGDTEGEYAKRVTSSALRIDKGFQQTDTFSRFDWLMTGKSRLAGRLGYLHREHDLYADRDYSGAVGAVDYTWLASGKWRLNTSFRRDLVSYQSSPQTDLQLILNDGVYFNSSYYRGQTFSVTPYWQVSRRIAMSIRYTRETREFLGGLLAEVTPREDELVSGLIRLDWSPWDFLKLSADVQQQERTSNVELAQFSSRLATVSLGLSF